MSTTWFACIALIAAAASPSDEAGVRLAVTTSAAASATSDGLNEQDVQSIEDRVVEGFGGEDVQVSRPPEVDALHSCEDAACRQRTLDAHRVSHALTIDIRGRDRVYELEIGLYEASSGNAIAPVRTAECVVCGPADLAELAATEATLLRASLPGPTEGTPAQPPHPLSLDVRDEPMPPRPPKPWRRPVAIGSIVGGLAFTTAGVVLTSLHGREDPGRCSNPDNVDADGDCKYVQNTLVPGVVSLLAGAGLTATGVTLLVVERRGRRRAEFTMGATTRRVTISGRF